LHYEEYEALKLSDYDGLNHEDAAKRTNVSRSTFARIHVSARTKIAEAYVESKEIKTMYGNALLEKNWFVCNECFARYSVPFSVNNYKCAICSSDSVEALKN
jgi:hypothetical protein